MTTPMPAGPTPSPTGTGLAVAVHPDPEGTVVRVAWTLDGGVAARWGAAPDLEVAGYDVWVCLEDLCIPWNTDGKLWTRDFLDVPAGIVAQSVSIALRLQLVVEWTDGTRSEAISAPFVVPPMYAVTASTDWTMGPVEVLVDNEARRRHGLAYWPDGSIGFATVEGTTYGFASNGPRCSRWRVDTDRFLGELLQVAEPIRDIDPTLSYASGNSVWIDPSTGTLLMFFHEEIHPDGDELRFWGAIGLAISHDEGVSFTSLGRIICPNIAADAPQRVALTEVGGAPFMIRDGVFHVYFKETLASGRALNMSVARADVREVLDGALRGEVVPWSKFRDDRWDEPGIGGVASELFPDAPTTRWFDLVHLVDHDRYVMVCSDGMADEWSYLIRTSVDGISWSGPTQVGETESGCELLYLSLAGTDLRTPHTARGDEVHLYRTRSATGGTRRWDDAAVERRVLRFDPATAPESVDDPDPG